MKPLQLILVTMVQLYRWTVSPAKTALIGGPSCRFTPSCSQYSLDALRRHGPVRGSHLTLRRLCRCHPWGGSGSDPVPELFRI